jgi:flagellar hook-length control protein FliK
LADLSQENREQLALLLRDAGFSATLTNAVNAGNLGQANFVQLLFGELWPQSPQYNAAIDLGQLAGLFNNKDFQALVKNDLNEAWLMKPEELVRERQVNEHFKQVLAQANRLLNALTAAGRGDTPTAQATNNLSNNVNFLNQLNQAFTYIQLPLKMNGENTHGELFVYTNKKHLARNDGTVSALLHLDMEHLGPLDVYVALQNKKVSTKFYLAGEQAINLIAKHIHVLGDRLTKRGYTVSSELVEREAERKPVEEILEANRNVSIIGSYSFDARA